MIEAVHSPILVFGFCVERKDRNTQFACINRVRMHQLRRVCLDSTVPYYGGSDGGVLRSEVGHLGGRERKFAMPQLASLALPLLLIHNEHYDFPLRFHF